MIANTMFTSVLFIRLILIFFFFFFNDTATTEIYTLSLHDALPISFGVLRVRRTGLLSTGFEEVVSPRVDNLLDRKSTRLNSSHLVISYAVFCLKKKKKEQSRHASHIERSREVVNSDMQRT